MAPSIENSRKYYQTSTDREWREFQVHSFLNVNGRRNEWRNGLYQNIQDWIVEYHKGGFSIGIDKLGHFEEKEFKLSPVFWERDEQNKYRLIFLLQKPVSNRVRMDDLEEYAKTDSSLCVSCECPLDLTDKDEVLGLGIMEEERLNSRMIVIDRGVKTYIESVAMEWNFTKEEDKEAFEKLMSHLIPPEYLEEGRSSETLS